MIKIVQKKQRGRGDSIFYQGEVASASKNGWLFSLIADGDVCVCLDGEYYGTCHANHHLEDLFEKPINLTDKKLGTLHESGRLTWENNNWFEVIFRKKGDTSWDCDIGEVVYDYDEAIQLLKDYMNEERFKR